MWQVVGTHLVVDAGTVSLNGFGGDTQLAADFSAGAVVFQRRKLGSEGVVSLQMGRLQWGRRLSTTETGQVRAHGRVHARFNGAVVFQRRKLITTGWHLCSQAGFNGAVVFQRRKLESVISMECTVTTLQWGRRLSTTETGDVAIKLIDPANRFNGAVVFQRRKREAAGVERVSRVVASMGPSSFNDGNWEMERGAQADCQSFNGAVVFQRRKLLNLLFFSLQVIWLQWGRRLSTTETSRR